MTTQEKLEKLKKRYEIEPQVKDDFIILTPAQVRAIAAKDRVMSGVKEIHVSPYGDKLAVVLFMFGHNGGTEIHVTETVTPDNCQHSSNFSEVAENRARRKIILKLAELYGEDCL